MEDPPLVIRSLVFSRKHRDATSDLVRSLWSNRSQESRFGICHGGIADAKGKEGAGSAIDSGPFDHRQGSRRRLGPNRTLPEPLSHFKSGHERHGNLDE